MKYEELALGDFINVWAGPDFDAKRKIAAEVQAYLILRNDALKSTIPDVETRKKALFDAIKSPAEMRTALINDSGATEAQIDAGLITARALVDARAGLGVAYEAVPPFGPILTNPGLGLVSRELKNDALLAQFGLRIKALLDGSTFAFTPIKTFPDDPVEVRTAGDAFTRLLDVRNKHGRLPKTIEREEYIDFAIDALRDAKEGLAAFPQAVAIIDAPLHSLESVDWDGYIGTHTDPNSWLRRRVQAIKKQLDRNLKGPLKTQAEVAARVTAYKQFSAKARAAHVERQKLASTYERDSKDLKRSIAGARQEVRENIAQERSLLDTEYRAEMAGSGVIGKISIFFKHQWAINKHRAVSLWAINGQTGTLKKAYREQLTKVGDRYKTEAAGIKEVETLMKQKAHEGLVHGPKRASRGGTSSGPSPTP